MAARFEDQKGLFASPGRGTLTNKWVPKPMANHFCYLKSPRFNFSAISDFTETQNSYLPSNKASFSFLSNSNQKKLTQKSVRPLCKAKIYICLQHDCSFRVEQL